LYILYVYKTVISEVLKKLKYKLFLTEQSLSELQITLI